MHMGKAFALGDAEAFEDAKNHQRGQTLSGRRQIIDRAVGQAHGKWLDDLRGIGGKIAAPQHSISHSQRSGFDTHRHEGYSPWSTKSWRQTEHRAALPGGLGA
jgi:hypothetical protein